MVKNQLVSHDVLKSWLNTSQFWTCMPKGFERLTLLLGLGYPGERFSDG